MLNKYISNLEELLNKYRDKNLEQFKGPNGKKAEFDDLVWYHKDPNTQREIRLLCTRFDMEKRNHSDNNIDISDRLPKPYNDLIKVYAIEVFNLSVSAKHKQRLIAEARKGLSLMDGELFQVNANSAKVFWGNRGISNFFQFCFDEKLLSPFYISRAEPRDRTGQNILDSRLGKLPSDQSLLALGAVFNDVFRNVNPDGSVKDGETVKMHDAITMTFSCLSLASPNRMASEISALTKQRLGEYSEKENPPIYYLDWKGSKGYRDNKNHILSSLSAQVKKSLNLFFDYSEPARILCRYYENSEQSLKKLLGSFKVEPERLQHIKMNRIPNLFQLGYALGFYDINECVYVIKDGINPDEFYNQVKLSCFFEKPIHSLTSQDRVATSISSRYKSLENLFKITIVKNVRERLFANKTIINISELQGRWITYFTKTIIPEFPLSYTSTETKINLKDAMFCILGNTGTGNSIGTKPMQKSCYSIVPLSYFSYYVARRLNGTNAATPSIFEDYGFSKEVALQPHALRHYVNTLADMSDIPIEIITAWSGRVNPDQTHTYIHTSEEEKVGRVRAIINPPSDYNHSFRFILLSELSQTTNLPATVTSTGICTQELNVTPCNYLNDFISQCFMCSESCHIAGDEESITFLNKDMQYQNQRLEILKKDTRLANSQAMQDWYVIHEKNTAILSALIKLMRECQKKTIIRFANSDNEFNLTDLKTKKITNVKLSLPNTEENLRKFIEYKTLNPNRDSNPELLSLLSSFGLAEKEP